MDNLASLRLSRRQLLNAGAAFSVAALVGLRHPSRADPGFRVIETKTISQEPQFYHGWPTIARRRNGQLWLAWSGGREAHVCPFGQVSAMTSQDEGATWSRSRVLYDGALDDRDAGVIETAKGTLLVTTFTSLAYEPVLEKAERTGTWPPDKLATWKATRDFLNPEQRKAALGEWVLRSTDGGSSWSAPVPTIVNSPHGPLQLADGRLLYAGKQLWAEGNKVGVSESKDDGVTWRWLAEIPARAGDKVDNGYHELHAVEAADGTLIAHIRNHSAATQGETLQTESPDGGRSWSEPHPIGVWGLPSHLLRLRDGRLLMTYGHRRAPFGNQARISTDHGKTWGEAMMISGDGATTDLGYPSTVELADGTLLTVWYEAVKGMKHAVLRQARWTMGA